ncbi:hypothetical protein TH25_21550 [Thalassospira profundimaris]|uniref:Probable membrane transporter protein n=1 Tax=Thalassospira profundimaris TaxID=502049 RepID=A0A367WPS3_9PROT|nr:sulfite exporter TauE/SafE family protein [Thalassospira profundimaris]RCK43475.1 hypothetical protein TH25_21550 [Thalassospira profundimaris]
MSLETTIIVACAYFLAAFVKGATGLGFSTSALPVMTLGLGLKSAMPLVIIPSIVSNVIVMVQAGHFRETVRRFWPMFVATIPGLIVGLIILDRVNGLVAGAVLGVVLMSYGIITLGRPAIYIPNRLARRIAPFSGFLTGLVNGVTGSQVMPILPFFLSLRLDPKRFVQGVNISFTLSSLIMAAGLSRIGLMTWHSVLISLAGLIPVFLGVKAGSFVRARLDAETFRKLVLVMLILFGIILIGKALLA